MYRIKISVKYIIHLIFILLLFVPYYGNCCHGHSQSEYWQSNFIYNNKEIAIFVIPIIILWLLVQLDKPSSINRFCKISLLLLTSIYSAYFILMTVNPRLDFAPDLGTLILIILFPILIGYFLIEILEKRTN